MTLLGYGTNNRGYLGPVRRFMALLDLTIQSSIEELQLIADRVDDVAEAKGWSQKAVFALQVSLDEWISNVIKYSYNNAANRPIRVTLREEKAEVVAEVEDEGEPFDPSASVVPETLEDTLSGKREGGMGLFVMRHLLSSLAYTQAGNKNIVTLRVSN